MVEIEKDLVRWSRPQWVAVVILILVVQSLLLFSASRTPETTTTPSRDEPSVSFSHGGGSSADPVAFEEPTLFASANPHGFSGTAWLVKTPWLPPLERSLPARQFLTFAEAASTSSSDVQQDLPPLTHLRPRAEPATPSIPAEPPQKSRLIVEDLPNRQLLSESKLPIQFATDAVRASIVQVLVGSDGLVLSSRLLRSSGSKAADVDALALARKARFTPTGNLGAARREEIAIGKLIFEWFARDPSQTNSVPAR